MSDASDKRNMIDANRWLNAVDVFDAFPSGVIVSDSEGVIRYCNLETTKLFGYSAEELLGQPVEILLPKELRNGHISLFKHYVEKPQKRSMGVGQELRACRKDDTTFPIEIGLNPSDTPSGKVVVATIIDITERRRLEENFKRIVESAPVGMLIVDCMANIKVVNNLLLSLFGYKRDELIGQKIEKLIPARHHHAHINLRDTFLSEPTKRAMGEERALTGIHKDGTEILVEVGLNPIETISGTDVIAAVSDVTERKRAELKLKQVNADLDEFTYVASHDLRSPLRGISNLMEWIDEDLKDAFGTAVPDDVSKNFARAHLRIERMEKLIDDLLSYARAGRGDSSIEKISLDKVIDDAIEMANMPDSFNVSVDCDIETITTSKVPLETVLRNLISNAVKHNDKTEGKINIKVKKEGSFCKFEIADNGPGIPDTAQDRVFKLFQALSAKDAGNSGVGLAVCKRLVEAHDGKISIESNHELKGATFAFLWPRFSRRDLDAE